MPRITYDSNIFIKYKPRRLPAGFYLSVVVLQELVAGATDKSAIKQLESSKREYAKADRLLVPDGDDWWVAGLVINALQRGRRSKKTGLIPKMTVQERYRVINDVLIARTAKREGAILVTDNVDDFKKIQRFCNVKLISGKDFFSL